MIVDRKSFDEKKKKKKKKKKKRRQNEASLCESFAGFPLYYILCVIFACRVKIEILLLSFNV